ncbi:MAG: SCO family protein [Chloroflexi bacterium]|nr:SCO family protein [Chloroflexota bacterium]
MKTKLVLGLGLTIVLMMAAGLWMATQPYAFHGSVIEPPMRAADFTLTAHNGKPFRLSDLTGKVVVVYFGYTTCPDVCPTTLVELKRVRAQLKQHADRVQFIFITIDPERDTLERLRGYVPSFDPSFIGLTGTATELAPVWRAFGVYRAKQPSESALGYLMDHSAQLYAIDGRGNLRVTFAFGETADNMTQDIKQLLAETRN